MGGGCGRPDRKSHSPGLSRKHCGDHADGFNYFLAGVGGGYGLWSENLLLWDANGLKKLFLL